jgi:hypothetical protein
MHTAACFFLMLPAHSWISTWHRRPFLLLMHPFLSTSWARRCYQPQPRLLGGACLHASAKGRLHLYITIFSTSSYISPSIHYCIAICCIIVTCFYCTITRHLADCRQGQHANPNAACIAQRINLRGTRKPEMCILYLMLLAMSTTSLRVVSFITLLLHLQTAVARLPRAPFQLGSEEEYASSILLVRVAPISIITLIYPLLLLYLLFIVTLAIVESSVAPQS